MAKKRKYDRFYSKSRYERNLKRLAKLKDNPCMDCGRREPHYNMVYDHRPGEIKIDNISNMMTWSWRKILVEIAKCDLVCVLCHGYRTHLYRDHRETVRVARKAKEEKQHEANAKRHRSRSSTSEWARQFP